MAPPALRRPRVRSPRALAILALLLLAAAGVWCRSPPGEAEVARGSAPEPPHVAERLAEATRRKAAEEAGAGHAGQASTPASPVLSEAMRASERAAWLGRLQRAKFALETYVAATRSPPESRLLREHPDRVHPAAPERTQPLGGEGSDVQVRLWQDKVFVAGEEWVTFTVSCTDQSLGNQDPLPCEVTESYATILRSPSEPLAGAKTPLRFGDDGAGGDALARDGTFTARFHPASQGFRDRSGTVRVVVKVRSGSTAGAPFFDLLYTATPPARFTGRVRETVAGGSLHLALGIEVSQPGRYVVTGRLDDASGAPFALTSFNQELRAGSQEVDLLVFGKLLVDEAPRFPLSLRDVEGFLLLEDADPDRALLPTLTGVVHTTDRYATSSFSPAEWDSEERRRYVDRFTDDVREAEAALDALERGRASP